MKSLLPAIFLSIVLFTGCSSTPPTLTEISNADYGTYPENYEDIVKNTLTYSLKDPDSAKINFQNSPKKFWIGSKSSRKFGYGVCALVNAKNSYGGYTGSEAWAFIIRNGVVVDMSGPTSEVRKYHAQHLCNEILKSSL
ncbi:hypothetical protein LG202_06580 [Methylobacillus methanolivorans]